MLLERRSGTLHQAKNHDWQKWSLKVKGIGAESEWNEVKVVQLCLTLCDPMVYTVIGILQARILEGVAFPFLQGIFPTQGSNPGLLHCRQILNHPSHKGSSRVDELVLNTNCSLMTSCRYKDCNSYKNFTVLLCLYICYPNSFFAFFYWPLIISHMMFS